MAYDAQLGKVKIYEELDLQNATVLNSDGNDISTQLADLDSIATAEFGYIDGLTPGTITASKAVVVDANKDIAAFRVVKLGAFSSVAEGTGVPISSSITGALKVYSDDAGASIATSCRGTLSRFLLSVGQTGGSIRALQGQLKLADGVDLTSGIYTASQGYVELAGDTSAKTGSTFSCLSASLEIASGKALTIDSGGEACGIHVETTGAGTISNSGTCAGILVSKASGAADWPVGLDLTSSCTTSINIGVCTTGIAMGICGTGIVMTGVTGRAIDIATSGVFRMGVQGTGVPVSTTYPFAMEVHCESAADISGGQVGATAAVYARYEVSSDQSTNCAHVAMFGKLRVKKDLADGNHAGLMGWVEISESGTVIGGTSTTTTSAGSFSIIADSNFELSTGHLNGVCVDCSVDDGSTITGTLAGIRLKKSSGCFAWPVGIAIEASSCAAGITIGTTSGTGLDFPATSTYGKAIAVGTFGGPIVYTADELIEIHGQVDAADASKPMVRFRNSAYASGAMTTGAVTSVQCQAYNVTTNNVGQLCALEGHVGIKGNATVLADAVASLPNMRAAWFKIEDLGNDLTLTGSAACVVLGKQFNTGTTLTGDSAYIWLLSQGNVGYNLNAIIEGKDGTGSGLATYLLDIPAAAPISANTHTIDGHALRHLIAVKLGGDVGYVPVLAGVPS